MELYVSDYDYDYYYLTVLTMKENIYGEKKPKSFRLEKNINHVL